MRTQQEIIARIKEREDYDLLGFETSEYARALMRENIRPFLAEDVNVETLETWTPGYTTDEEVLAVMKDYVEFAYGKIRDQRGISANRSILHYMGWLWLIGNDELRDRVQHEFDTNYDHYGLPIMDMIVAQYGWKRPDMETA